ncbi:c-type cytochrome [Virgibacillus halophilus]|uniref:C-type cytochrome n=2 Tax=Tigheibacillus halophilus TaxID=361280 RepID=A0ABU5C6G5_9BACI|nr:c-type cytochrome [Virgibacillus halophilus]
MDNNMEKTPEPDITRGAELFDRKNCISCHATDGSGTGNETGPALWGENSFNDAAGMARFSKAAGYIQNNMPRGLENTLTDQEAADLAAFMLSHERPVADKSEVGTYHLNPGRDYITKERRKKIRDKTFDWESLDSVKKAKQ